jgi:hypothetical protein
LAGDGVAGLDGGAGKGKAVQRDGPAEFVGAGEQRVGPPEEGVVERILQYEADFAAVVPDGGCCGNGRWQGGQNASKLSAIQSADPGKFILYRFCRGAKLESLPMCSG